MPPPSSPFPRLSSVPSDVFTVHTIASRSPPRHRRTSNQRERNDGHPVRFWAMQSPPPRNRSTSNQRPQGSASTVCHPSRLWLVLFLPLLPLLQVVRARQSKRASRRGRKRENQGEGCRRHLRPFLSSVCCHHRPHLRPFFPSVFVCGSCYSSP